MAGGQAAAQGQQGEGEGAGGQQQGLDAAALAEQLGSLTESQEQLRQFLQSQPWQQQAEQEPEVPVQQESLDFSQLIGEADPYVDPEQFSQNIAAYISQEAQRQAQDLVRQEVDPIRSEWAQQRIKMEAQELVDEFPEMATPEVAKRIAGEGGIADQLAAQLGQPELAKQPGFWRIAYIASRAMDAMQEEGSEQPPAGHMEGGGGAMPGADAPDMGDLIVESRAGSRALPFR